MQSLKWLSVDCPILKFTSPRINLPQIQVCPQLDLRLYHTVAFYAEVNNYCCRIFFSSEQFSTVSCSIFVLRCCNTVDLIKNLVKSILEMTLLCVLCDVKPYSLTVAISLTFISHCVSVLLCLWAVCVTVVVWSAFEFVIYADVFRR